MLDPWWAEHYPAALAKAGTIPFLRDGAGRHAGVYDVSAFLRDGDEVRKIIDGVYDPHVVAPPPRLAGAPTVADVIAADRAKREEEERKAKGGAA